MKNVCLLFLAIVMFSCTSDTTDYNETCIEFETAGIEQIEPAVTIDMVGRPYNVFFRVKNGCGDFNNFDEKTSLNFLASEDSESSFLDLQNIANEYNIKSVGLLLPKNIS